MNDENELNPPVLDGYTKIPTFKLWVANNFPYMETDFDGITNYDLLGALTNYLNNVIKNEENLESNVSALNQAYLELFNYVKDYFDNLDVQEEINNKLDDLVADGTLTRLIGEYVQPLIEAQNQEISNFKTQVNGQIAGQNAKIEAVESGSPLVASSVSEMTDTTRVYVNTTDGYWYYYNSTNWVQGGVYQSTGIADNSILVRQLNSSTKDYINNAYDNIVNAGEIGAYKKFNFHQGAFNNNNGYYQLDPFTNAVLIGDYPILLPTDKIFKFKAKDPYKMSIYTYELDQTGYKYISNIAGMSSTSLPFYARGDGQTYIQIRFFREDSGNVLVEDIENIVEITEVSNVNENKKAIFGVEGSTEVSNRHSLESTDFEILNNANILYNKDTQVQRGTWGVVATLKNKFDIEKVFNTSTIIVIKEDLFYYYGVNLFANKGSLYKIQKNLLYNANFPKQDNYFEVGTVWNNLANPSSIKIEKNGNDLKLYVQDNVGYTEFFSFDECNIVGIFTASTGGYHQNLNNVLITTYDNLSFDGLIGRVRSLEEKVESGGSSSELEERFKTYKILCIGDSITERNNRATTNWVDYINNWLTPNTITNRGHSGTGIVNAWGDFANWYNDLDNLSSNYDLILIMGNMNDYSSLSFDENSLGQFGDNTLATQYGALKLYIEKLINKYPKAKIGWITSTPRQYQSGATVSNPGYLWGKNSVFENANTAIKISCENYSIPVLDLFHESNLMPWNNTNRAEYFSTEANPTGDGVHPNDKGQKIIAYKIYDFIIRNF